MGVMSASVSIAGNTTNDNLLAGKTEEFLRRPSSVLLAITGGGSDVYCTLIVGNEILVDAQILNPTTGWPIFPDNLFAEGVGDQQERIVLRIENRNSLARIVQMLLDTRPI